MRVLKTFGLWKNINISFVSPSTIYLRNYSNKFSMDSTVTDLISIFNASVAAVSPQTLIKKNVQVHDADVTVCGKNYKIPDDGCHIIGFGKAVLGMAVELEKLLSSRVAGGIVNVPIGIFETFKDQPNLLPTEDTRLKFLEGAENNLPDENSVKNTQEIIEYIGNLEQSALIFVLISGGGSALFSLPKPPITLEEKQSIIKKLALSGADITELNTVRKQLSIVKGGGLAKIAQSRQLICLILSDVIGDPLDLIASGPTTVNTDDIAKARNILKNYGMNEDLPDSIKEVLYNYDSPEDNVCQFKHVDNYLIGNNKKAIAAAKNAAEKLNYSTYSLSSEVKGEVSTLSYLYSELAADISSCYVNEVAIGCFKSLMDEAKQYFKLADDTLEELYNKIQEFKETKTNGICIINGGEPTVLVHGSGKGGRNQQLTLEYSSKVEKLPCCLNSYFLSSGTDGIDGPTDAAGAIGFKDLAELASEESLDVHPFICDNDAYSFYSSFHEGKFLIKTGHTGTNVMDIHILIIK